MNTTTCIINDDILESIQEFALRHPWKTELGRQIIIHGIELCNTLGFEEFTFKKLGDRIGSPEASIYRYFENKHKLLLYIMALYWGGIDKLCFSIVHNNSKYSKDKLKSIINVLCSQNDFIVRNELLNGIELHNVVIAESAKSYFTKHVDDDNQHGAFKTLKSLTGHIAELVQEVSPHYEFPRALATTIIEMSLFQFHFAAHLPSLTEIKKGDSQAMADWLIGLIPIENEMLKGQAI